MMDYAGILKNPKDKEILICNNLVKFSALRWSLPKPTSFNLEYKLLQRIDKFAKSINASKADIISQSIFELIEINTRNNKEFKPCIPNFRIKTSLSLPSELLNYIREYVKQINNTENAQEKKVSDSDIINRSICDFLNRYKACR